jgi:hypothetical protein
MMLPAIAAGLVGAVFVATGVLKALDSRRFAQQLMRYRLLRPRLLFPAVLAFIGVECALGVALILGVSIWLLPAAALLLAGFAGLTAWGTRTGRVEDCGCYGGLVMLTPAQSVALDGLYVALLALAWLFWTRTGGPAVWTIAVVLLAGAAATAAAWRSRSGALVNLGLLRVGRRWRRGWLKRSSRDVTSGAHFVVFLSRDCPYCKNWVPFLNVIEVQPDLPSVTAVMSLDEDAQKAFLAEHLIKFPVTFMPTSLVALMVEAYPTAALVENGRVTGTWRGEMPEPYLTRVKQFIETISSHAAPAAKPFAG